jgi:hypothetical protein
MTRKSQLALPSLTKLAGALLCAAAIAAPAQAANIGFEADYSMSFGSGDTYSESGYKMTFEAYDPTAVGSAVGSLIDSSDPFACVNMACPIGGDGLYYGAFNDSIVWLESETAGAQFQFNSIDASFIGADPDLGSYPAVAGLLRIQGWLADGSWMTQDLLLDRPGPGGFSFGRYEFDGLFAATEFVYAAMFGFVCDAVGDCTAFNSNQGQFAIDNLNLTDIPGEVPEPASVALFGLGMMGLLAAARRRKA